MFERYTEKARRVIFFARYEASHLGSSSIEPHHILLGLIREDKQIINRLCFRRLPPYEMLINRIRAATAADKRTPTSVDLPLSQEGKAVLAYTAEEAERLEQRHIGTEHMLLGLLRVERTVAADLLAEYEVKLDQVRAEIRNGISAKSRAEKDDRIEELRQLAAEARQLAAEMIGKADRIDEICDQMTGNLSDGEQDH